ncbi:MAG: DUF1566 domain-containing protein [Flavobacteriales bacterium]
MNHLRFSVLLLFICVACMAAAQSPQKMSYQMVVRNASGNLVMNANVSVRISILQGSSTGIILFQEEHPASTNANGLATLEIGGGQVIAGSFAGIDWSNGPYFVKSEIDPNGGSSFSLVHTAQFLSVPYALYAENAGNSTPGPQGPPGADGAPGPVGATGAQGPPGAGLSILGSLNTIAELPVNGTAGDSYLISGELHVWDSNTNSWINAGNIQGPQGPQGAQGPAGTNGVNGVNGADGAAGPQGPTGPQGAQGPQGIQGPQGPQGPSGSLPNGSAPGEMLYWNGAAWISVAPGATGTTLTMCDGVPTWGDCPPAPLAIGDAYQGGVIFYLDGNGHGLIAATSDQSIGALWGCEGTSITTQSGLNTGLVNTEAIYVTCQQADIAARICYDLSLNGYTDWYLPSRDELDLIYQNQAAIGGFNNGLYWSSSQATPTTAYYKNFSNGNTSSNFKSGYYYRVRAIRSF